MTFRTKPLAKVFILFTTVFITLNGCEHEPFEPITSTNPIDTTTTDSVDLDCYEGTVYFQEDVLPIISANCYMSGCHDATSKQDGVDLSNYDQIISTGRIKPNDPEDSEFYNVLNETDPAERMPLSRSELSDCDKKAIYQWIVQGAMNSSIADTTDSSNVPSFAVDVEPIISTNCAVSGCHVANAQSPALTNYSEIKAKDQRVKVRTGNGSMPVGGSLTNTQIQIIADWVDGGSPNN